MDLEPESLFKQIEYKIGYKYQVFKTYICQTAIRPLKDIETYYISLSMDGRLTIRRGYAWDGPSGPTFDTLTFMRGSCNHDVKYQLIRMGLIDLSCREIADNELKSDCLEDGMCSLRAWWVRCGVGWFAGFAAKRENRKKVYTAP